MIRNALRALDPSNPLARIYVLMLVFDIGEGGLRFLLPIRMEDLGFNFTSIGTATSAFAAATLIARVPTGALYRPDTAKRIIVAAGALSSAAFLALPMADGLGVITTLMILDGVGWGVVTTLLLTVMMSTRPAGVSAAAAMGWYVGFNGIGHALASTAGGLLGDTVGVRSAFFVLGALPFVASLMIGSRLALPAPATSNAGAVRGVRAFSGLPLAVWVACFAALYLNVMNSIMNVFFPILALGLGLSLSQAGALAGIRSFTSAIARFGAIPIMDRFDRSRLEVPLMAASAVSTAVVPLTGSFVLQAPIWTVNGVTRGFVRVGTGADAMESLKPGQEGAAASMMSMGLDAGKIVGPLMVGVIADRIGTASAFHVVPTLLFVVYVGFRLIANRRPMRKEPSHADGRSG